MWGDFIAACVSPAVLIALITLLLKVFPSLAERLADNTILRSNPDRLPASSWVVQHLDAIKQHGEALNRLESSQFEVRKDTIKNTIIMLMNLDGDHRSEVRYELAKLEAMDCDCWVVDAARRYVLDGDNPLQ